MKFLKKITALAMMAAAALGGFTACSDSDNPNPPVPEGEGTLTITVGEKTYNSVEFTIASTESPAPTMYAYSVVARGTTMSATQLFEAGTKAAVSSAPIKVSNLAEQTQYTILAVSMGSNGLSEVASADFETAENNYGPETALSMGVQINEVTTTTVNMTYMLGSQAALGMVTVWGRVVLENQILNAQNEDPSVSVDDIVKGLMIDQGYGQFVVGNETVTWEEELRPNADYVVMTLGMANADTPGDVQLTYFHTASFPTEGAAPDMEIRFVRTDDISLTCEYVLNEHSIGFQYFITEKAEIDDFLKHYTEEDLRQFVVFHDGLWLDMNQTETKQLRTTVGWDKGGVTFTVLALALDKNLMTSELKTLDVTIPEEQTSEPAEFNMEIRNIAATNCDVHFDFGDNCLRAYYRIETPSRVEGDIASQGELAYTRDLWYGGWAVFRQGNQTPSDPIAKNDEIQMDLVPGTTYVIVATGLNYDGSLSPLKISEPFTTKEFSYENSQAEVTIEVDQIDREQVRAVYYTNDKVRILYHAILKASEPAPDFSYLYTVGNLWPMSTPESADEWDSSLQASTWTWTGMIPGTEYVYYYCAEDTEGAISPIKQTRFQTVNSTPGPNPDAELRVYDVTSTSHKFDIVLNSQVANYLYLTVQESMLNYDPQTGTQQELEDAIYTYVLSQGIPSYSSIYGGSNDRMNPNVNYYTAVIVYGSGTAEKFIYEKFTTVDPQTSEVKVPAMIAAHGIPSAPVAGGEAKNWDNRKRAAREAFDRSFPQQDVPMILSAGDSTTAPDGQEASSFKDVILSMRKWR